MFLLETVLENALHLFYPHLCDGCGNDQIAKNQLLCYRCLKRLPTTNFIDFPDNSVERLFRGRLSIAIGHSEYFFSKGKLIQHLLHQLKYKSNKGIGFYLGEMMGQTILQSNRFSNPDIIIPMPISKEKEIKRGYNQANIIAMGLSNILKIPVSSSFISKTHNTESQTNKNRSERWKNVEGSFVINQMEELINKSILLIDDVITTGATIEACGNMILKIPGTQLSVASLAIATK